MFFVIPRSQNVLLRLHYSVLSVEKNIFIHDLMQGPTVIVVLQGRYFTLLDELFKFTNLMEQKYTSVLYSYNVSIFNGSITRN